MQCVSVHAYYIPVRIIGVSEYAHMLIGRRH